MGSSGFTSSLVLLNLNLDIKKKVFIACRTKKKEIYSILGIAKNI